MNTKSFGSYLAELRRAKKLTQKEVADRLYVSDKIVSRWETDRSLPELSLVPALADLLEISADELLPAIAVIAVVLVCSLILRTRRA